MASMSPALGILRALDHQGSPQEVLIKAFRIGVVFEQCQWGLGLSLSFILHCLMTAK